MPKRKGARFTAPLPLFSSSITCYLLQTPWLSLNKDPKLLKEKEQFVKVQSLSTTQEKKSTEAEHPELWYQGCCHLLLPAIISGYHFAVQPSGIISIATLFQAHWVGGSMFFFFFWCEMDLGQKPRSYCPRVLSPGSFTHSRMLSWGLTWGHQRDSGY